MLEDLRKRRLPALRQPAGLDVLSPLTPRRRIGNPARHASGPIRFGLGDRYANE